LNIQTKPKRTDRKRINLSSTSFHPAIGIASGTKFTQSQAAIPPTTPAPITPTIDMPTFLAAPVALGLLEVLLAALPPSVREGTPCPAQSVLYVFKTFWPTDCSEAEGAEFTIQLMQVWIPSRFEVVQMQVKDVQAETVLMTEVHWLWHAGGNELGLTPVGVLV